MQDKSKTKFLTGIRAYAALGVLLVHTGGAGLSVLGKFGENVTSFGKYGVVVFFVLSAFTICLSLNREPKFDFRKYALRRIFRIYPMYAAAILLAIAINLLVIPQYSWGKELFYHLSFLNLFVLEYRNTLLNVEWTIPIEVFYYFLLPVVYFYINRNRQRAFNIVLGGLAITLASSFLILPYYDVNNLSTSRHFSIEAYAFTYACGIALFFAYEKLKQLKLQFNSWHLAVVSILLLMYTQFPSRNDYADIVFVTGWSCVLILVCGSGPRLSKLLFENKAAEYLGTISYSFYLIHFLVLKYLPEDMGKFSLFMITFVITLVLSSITYFLIERVYMNMGKRLEQSLILADSSAVS